MTFSADEPMFADVHQRISEVTRGKCVLIYNYEFDRRALRYEHQRIDAQMPVWGDGSGCLMEMYAQWYGEWSNWHGSYKWQPLVGGDHSALGDCRAALAVLREMAEIEPNW